MKFKTLVQSDNYRPDNKAAVGSAIKSRHNNSKHASLKPFWGRHTSPESLLSPEGILVWQHTNPLVDKGKYSRRGQIKFNILCCN